MKHIARVNTPSKRWAKRNGACLAGLRRLGRSSIWHYFQTCWNMNDMHWIAAKLEPRDPSLKTEYVRSLYRRSSWVRGSSSNVLLARVAICRIMDAFDVQWPSEIL